MTTTKSVPCAKVNSCPKVKSIHSRDWAGDWQLNYAITLMCSACEVRDCSEVLWRKEHFLGFDIVQLERNDRGLVVVALDETGWHRRQVWDGKA